MKAQQPRVYMDKSGELVILRDRIAANAHDRIYDFEMQGKKRKLVRAYTITSPGKLGLKCLGAL
jgi:hypothetical protein